MILADEILAILAEFGGLKGGAPGPVAVRFLLPTFFWGILAWIAYKEWLKTKSQRDLYIGIASIIGMARELLMLTAEYGSLRGHIPFDFMYSFYPPLEHAATMLSCILIASAFMNYLLGERHLSRRFLIISSAITLFLYFAMSLQWPAYLKDHPGASFHTFWGEWADRIAAIIFMGYALWIIWSARRRGSKVQNTLIIGLLFFFLDEFLMIFNLAAHDRYVNVYAPIRHNFHIWAIPLFLGTYWGELRSRLSAALAQAESEKSKTDAIMASIGEAVTIQDTNYRIIYQNDIQKEITGNRVGDYCYKAYENKESPCEDCHVARAFQDGHIHRAERTLQGPEGVKYISVTASPLKDAEGTIIAGIEISRDVTERRQMEEQMQREIAERIRIGDMLFESEQRYRDIVETQSENVIRFLPGGNMTYMNEAVTRASGIKPEALLGKSFYLFIHEEDREAAIEKIESLTKEEPHNISDARIVLPDGSAQWHRWTNRAIFDDRGDIVEYQSVGRDISERKLAEELLRESEDMFKSFAENALVGIYLIQDGIMKYVNPQFMEMIGYTLDDCLDKNFIKTVVYPDDLPVVLDTVKRRILGEITTAQYDFRLIKKTGEITSVEVYGSRVFYKNRPAIIGTILDISKRKQAEEELKRAHNLLEDRVIERTKELSRVNESLNILVSDLQLSRETVSLNEQQLKALVTQLSSTEEHERRRIATALHENIGQILALIRIELGSLTESVSSAEACNEIRQIRALIDEVIQFVRTLTVDLSPPMLYELGFHAALQRLAEQFREKYNIRFHFISDGERGLIDQGMSILLYNVVRELMVNIVKHGKAKIAKVSVMEYADEIKIIVEDDGIGFDTTRLRPDGSNEGFGILNIAERLSSIGGRIEIQSAPNTGTTVLLAVPQSQSGSR
jgi:PAS domain S-box-containing protein